MDTKFDEKLDRMEKSQRMSVGGNSVLTWPTWDAVRDSSVFVTDTLDLCWVAAQSIFADRATPEHALAIYDRMSERLEFLGMQEAPTDDDNQTV